MPVLIMCGDCGPVTLGWGCEDGEGLFIPDASLCISFIVLMIDESSFPTSSTPSIELVFGFLIGGSKEFVVKIEDVVEQLRVGILLLGCIKIPPDETFNGEIDKDDPHIP